MFSELTEKTFNFFESCCEQELRPIFVILPSKKKFGISLSARILKKFWLQDLTSQPTSFKTGDIIVFAIPPNIIGNKNSINLKVRIRSRGIVIKTWDAVTKTAYEIVPNNTDAASHFDIEFNQDDPKKIGRYIIPREWIHKYGTIITEKVPLTNSTLFIRCYNELKSIELRNNTIAMFLGNDSPVTKAQLRSKVYFIAGRGKVDDIRYYIEKIGLKEALNEGLIVKESLRDFADILRNDQNRQSKISSFVRVFNSVFGSSFDPEEEDLKKYLDEITRNLRQGNTDITELRSLIDRFMAELINNGYSDEYESLNNISKTLPEVTLNELNISLVKSVIIDKTELTEEYTDIIRKLISSKIPVIVLSDYANYTNERREKINNFSRDFPNAFRLNWNKAKMISLEEIKKDSECLDKEAFSFCKKYQNQRVTIEAFNDTTNIIDKFFDVFEIRGLLRRLDGFEGIKNAYTIHLRPVVYWVKNIPGTIEITNNIIVAVNNFQETYVLVRGLLNAQESEIVKLLDEFLTLFSNEGRIINNSKTLDNVPADSNYFAQTSDKLAENELTLANLHLDYIENRTLVFTGTPYQEVKHFYLRKAIFEDFDKIYFMGFCKEAESMFQKFINGTINFNSSINDVLPNNYVPFWNSVDDLDTNATYLNERCSEFKNDAKSANEDMNFDEVQDLIELARYHISDKDDLPCNITDKDSKVAVNILELDGNNFVFIKKTEAKKLLVLKRNKNFDMAGWDEINPGDRVFTYIITRQDTLEMRGENAVDASVFQHLDIWYERLKILYKKFNRSYIDLSKRLNDLKIENNLQGANPSPSNLRNWLHKDRIINVPEKENLRLILLAAETSDLTADTKKIRNAKKKVEKLDRSNRENIKTLIQRHIKQHDIEKSDNFSIIVNLVPITVRHGVVKHKVKPDNLKMDQDRIGIILNYNKSKNEI